MKSRKRDRESQIIIKVQQQWFVARVVLHSYFAWFSDIPRRVAPTKTKKKKQILFYEDSEEEEEDEENEGEEE